MSATLQGMEILLQKKPWSSAVIIWGGAVLLDGIRRSYRRYAFHVLRDTPIMGAELGNDAGIYGCVKMVHMDGQA